MERMQMERMLATPADAEIILKLYDLRRETVMRQARAWVIGEFWPETADDYFALVANSADPHNAFLQAGDYLLGDGGSHGAARRGFRGTVCGLQRRGLLPPGQVCADSRRHPPAKPHVPEQDLGTGQEDLRRPLRDTKRSRRTSKPCGAAARRSLPLNTLMSRSPEPLVRFAGFRLHRASLKVHEILP